MVMSVLGCKGYERTLDEMKLRLGDVLGWKTDRDVPSAPALCQARRKLDAQRCRELSSEVYQRCSAARTRPSIGYAGLRLLALDGSKLALPAYKALREHFGCPTHGEGKDQQGPQASFTLLWDVGANQPVAWRLGPYRLSERVQGMELTDSLGRGDLLIADRGFPSRRMLLAVRQRGADFLMRIGCTGATILREVSDFLASGAADAPIDIHERHRGQMVTDAPALAARLLRVTLPNGITGVFITSLRNPVAHPASALLDLYTQRWRVETAFRELKLWHGLERFHARHVEGIEQEICALMLFQLLASEVEARVRIAHSLDLPPAPLAQPQSHDVAAMDVRFNRRILADCVVNLLFAATKDDLAIEREFAYSLRRLWRYRQRPKPGRTFKRERKSPARGWARRGTKGKGRP